MCTYIFFIFFFQAKTEEQVLSEQAFLEAERVWLVHKEGFAAAGQLKDEESPAQEGRVRVQLDYNGDIIEVKQPWAKISTVG